MRVAVVAHPLLEPGAFVVRFSAPLGSMSTPPPIAALAGPDAVAPLVSSEEVRVAVRALLRHGGYKPSGRGKPASEYLAAALAADRFPSINALVDACNVVSLHAGLPISLVDFDRLSGAALRIDVAPPGTTYVFNASGQTIDASGLVALFDAEGPTGTPVKDAQRTKTSAETRTAIAVVWGTVALPGLTARTTAWFRELVRAIPGATTEDVLT